MGKYFALSNTPLCDITTSGIHIQIIDNLCLYSQSYFFHDYNNIKVAIDGFIIPCYDKYSELRHFKQHKLIEHLYNLYGNSFIDKIKGIFCIILITQGQVKIFTDQYGIYKLFYRNENGRFVCSNSVKLLFKINNTISINPFMLAVKSLLNHEINGNTVFNGIHYTQPATIITLSNNSIRFDTYYNCRSLLENHHEDRSYLYFADLIKDLVYQYHSYLEYQETVISLTGGKDSRTILTGLLGNNILPKGVTYGCSKSRDAFHAKLLSEKAGIEHYIINIDKSAEWFEKISLEIIGLGNPLININRGHRYYAFKKMNEITGEDAAYYAGYMGGELFMGIYYDNLIFSEFLTNTWEGYSNPQSKIRGLLSTHFINIGGKDIENVVEQYSRLQSVNLALDKLHRQFYGLFEIGVFHHSQDLYLSNRFFKYPIPLFLDIDFLHELFGSYFSFLFRDNKTKNLLKRYKLYEFNLNIQHILYPSLDNVPFAKKGSYNTLEFLKGSLYWSIVKSFRYLFEKKNFPPSFSYNDEYKKFLVKWLNEILLDKTSDLHAVYNVQDALIALNNSRVLKSESQLLPFSGIVMHYLQLKSYS